MLANVVRDSSRFCVACYCAAYFGPGIEVPGDKSVLLGPAFVCCFAPPTSSETRGPSLGDSDDDGADLI